MRVHRVFRCFSVPLVVALLGLLIPLLSVTPVSAAAATYTVGLSGDDDGTHTANCANATNTDCRLRDAVTASNANDPGAGQNTIQFKAGLVSPIVLIAANGTLTLSKKVAIQGPGADMLAVDGGCTGCDPGGTPVGGVTVFTFGSIAASISGLTIQHGHNAAPASPGGGIRNGSGGTLTVRDAVIAHNNSGFGGGGIFNIGATLIVDKTTFEGNTAGQGAGINNNTAATLTVTNSTFSNNHAKFGGGMVIFNIASVTNSTIINNSATMNATSAGGGIINIGTLTLSGMIIAGNTSPTGPDVNAIAAITDGGYNLIGSPGGNTFVDGTNHDKVGTLATPLDPQLSVLGAYGGHTPTHALLPGSPALDAIPAATLGCGTTLLNDQRGVTRPQPTGGTCDIGAFESTGPPAAITPIAGTSPQSTPVGASFALPLAVKVTNPLGNPAPGVVVTFTAPATGPSGSFAGGMTTATTNVSGIATAPSFFANNTQGSYQVTATVNGLTTNFALTNTAVPVPPSKPGAAPSGSVPPVDSRTGSAPTGAVLPPPTGR